MAMRFLNGIVISIIAKFATNSPSEISSTTFCKTTILCKLIFCSIALMPSTKILTSLGLDFLIFIFGISKTNYLFLCHPLHALTNKFLRTTRSTSRLVASHLGLVYTLIAITSSSFSSCLPLYASTSSPSCTSSAFCFFFFGGFFTFFQPYHHYSYEFSLRVFIPHCTCRVLHAC